MYNIVIFDRGNNGGIVHYNIHVPMQLSVQK